MTSIATCGLCDEQQLPSVMPLVKINIHIGLKPSNWQDNAHGIIQTITNWLCTHQSILTWLWLICPVHISCIWTNALLHCKKKKNSLTLSSRLVCLVFPVFTYSFPFPVEEWNLWSPDTLFLFLLQFCWICKQAPWNLEVAAKTLDNDSGFLQQIGTFYFVVLGA